MPEALTENRCIDLTILLPAYNEEDAIVPGIQEIRAAMQDWPGEWEILIVDDASTDRTMQRAVEEKVRVLQRVERGGAGAARKFGIREARGKLIAMLDADGSYDASWLPKLLEYFPNYDQVNGARTTEEGSHKIARSAAKWLIRKLAEWVSGKRIPDLNTGMKIFKRDLMLRYLWAIPDGFSCVSSMTLAFACNGHSIKYVFVPYRKRIGESKFRPIQDTANYFMTVFRIVMYFRPLRVLFPAFLVLGLIAVVRGTCNIATSPLGLQDLDVIIAIAAFLTLVMGILAEIIAAQKR